ncbi:killer cell lectin-like receptor subfamily F member 1 [Pogona vitticeps]
MAGEVVYADLNISSEPHRSTLLHPSQQCTLPHYSHWHWIALWVGYIGNVVLLAAVIFLVLYLETGNPDTDVSGTKCNTTLEDFQAHLRRVICNQSLNRSSVNSTCRICPVDWLPYREKCYWRSLDMKRWKDSQADCATKNSHLVVIQDEEEMEFLKKNITDHIQYWIGLVCLSEVEWAWVADSQFKPDLLPKENQCGVIKNTILSDNCNSVQKRICEKDAFLL